MVNEFLNPKAPKEDFYKSAAFHPAKKARGKLTSIQQEAALMKIEEQLSDHQIARRLDNVVTPQAIGQWWKKPHIINFMNRRRKVLDVEVYPVYVKRLNNVREQLLIRIEEAAEKKQSLSPTEVNALFKTITSEFNAALDQIERNKKEISASEIVDDIDSVLTDKEKIEIARRRMGMGVNLEIKNIDK